MKLSQLSPFCTLACLLFLSGCAMMPKGSSATLQIQSATYLNPDINSTPSPVVLNIYQLNSAYAFQQASFHQLYDTPSKTLSGSLIDKSTLEIRPGQTQTFSQPLLPNTQYLGIVAAYRKIGNNKWKAIVKIKDNKSHAPVLHLDLESEDLNVLVSESTPSVLGISL